MSKITVALAQIAPVWLDRAATLTRIEARISEAGAAGADLVCFGESLLPGYPFWLSLTHGARFDDRMQKEIYAHYVRQAVDIEAGGLGRVQAFARTHGVAVYLGIAERPIDRGGHSLYCTLVYINKAGEIQSVHRKLQPTYEERLVWGAGDGHGLRVHDLSQGWRVGGLNCWENWLPMARQALYAQGENLHVAVWPGAVRNTEEITRFIARESRSFVVSASSVLRVADIPAGFPYRDEIVAAVGAGSESPGFIADGGSAVAGPDGEWVLVPQAGTEGLFVVELDLDRVYEERQNFDPSGHYSRPDVLRVTVDRERQGVVRWENERCPPARRVE